MRLHILTTLISLSAAFVLPTKRDCQTALGGSAQGSGTTATHTVCVGSISRSFLLFLPADYDTAITTRPVILSYHGSLNDAASQQNLDLLTNPYFNTDAIVVYPQGLGVRFLFISCV